MHLYLFLALSIKYYFFIRTVSALGIAKEAPAILDYEDESLFDGKPVQHHEIPNKHINYRRNEDNQEYHDDAVTGQSAFAENIYVNAIEADNMNHPDKLVLNNMVEELFQDAEAKVFEVGIIIDMHKAATSFEVGKIIGLIQAKYRHQMELWRELSSKEVRFGFRPRTRMWPAAWSAGKQWTIYGGTQQIPAYPRMNDYYILIYAMIFELERDIDNLIDMLHAIPQEDLQLKPSTLKVSVSTRANQKTTKAEAGKRTSEPEAKQEIKTKDEELRHGRYEGNNDNYGLRPRPTRKKEPIWMPGGAGFRRKGKELEQEIYKHRLREKYLLRKLGLNDTGHTSKPRFRMGWPIEETWDNVPQY